MNWKGLLGKLTARDVFLLSLVVVLYVLVSFFAKSYESYLMQLFLLQSWAGVIVYIMLIAVGSATPMSTVIFMPMAVVMWGSWWSAVYTMIGWWLGAVVVFMLTRKYGRPLVVKFVDPERLAKFEGLFPRVNVFWMMVYLRIIFPVDILSFGLGLVGGIKLWQYVLATLLGIIPPALILAFFAKISIFWQILMGMILIFLLLWFFMKKNNKKI